MTVAFRRVGIYEGNGCSHPEVSIEAISGEPASAAYVFCAVEACGMRMPYRKDESGQGGIIVDIETEKAFVEVPYKIEMV